MLGHDGAERVVDLDEAAALEFDPDLFQSQVRAERIAPDRDQHGFGFDGFRGAAGVERDRPALALALHRLVAVPEHHRDSALDERAAQLLGDFGVEAGQHLLFQFDRSSPWRRRPGRSSRTPVPIAPAPMIGDAFGRWSCSSASRLVITPSPIVIPGNSRSPEPAAIRMRSASIAGAAGGGLPAAGASATRMRSGDRRARPRTDRSCSCATGSARPWRACRRPRGCAR